LSDRSKRHRVIIVLAALLLLAVPLPSSTGEDGWEPDHVIRWGPNEGAILISESMEIAEDTRLVIEAGTMVRLDINVSIQVRGHLVVEGTEGAPVMFTTNSTDAVAPDQWDSVDLLSISAGRLHTIDHAVFQGADIGLLVSSTDAMVQGCLFNNNRYGLLARGDARVEVRNSQFINNSVLGLEWETGAGGLAANCEFSDNVVGIYCYEGSAPLIVDSTFYANYHHVSFAGGSNGTVRRCAFRNAIAESYECYNTSSPLFEDVTIVGTDEDAVHLRGGSRPRMVGGTAVSRLVVDAKDNASYVVAMTRITVEVTNDEGKRLKGANVTVMGASGAAFSEGVTDSDGRLGGAMMSLYTVDDRGSLDRENPHTVLVEWRGNEQTFLVDPRDLDNDKVLRLEMDLSPPEPGGWGFIPNMLILIAISAIAIVAAWLYQSRR
jgi:hypothetical protein